MKNCIETYKLPAAWASFLINGDSSGTDEEELTAIKAFCRRNGLPVSAASCEPAGFSRFHDAMNEMPLAAIRKFCETWQAKHSALLDEAYATGYDESQAGRDFFYEHVGHGVGFSDRDELTASSDEELKAELQAEMRAAGTTPQRWNELFAQVKAMESDIAERLSDAAGHGEVNPYYGEDSKIHVDLY